MTVRTPPCPQLEFFLQLVQLPQHDTFCILYRRTSSAFAHLQLILCLPIPPDHISIPLCPQLKFFLQLVQLPASKKLHKSFFNVVGAFITHRQLWVISTVNGRPPPEPVPEVG